MNLINVIEGKSLMKVRKSIRCWFNDIGHSEFPTYFIGCIGDVRY